MYQRECLDSCSLNPLQSELHKSTLQLIWKFSGPGALVMSPRDDEAVVGEEGDGRCSEGTPPMSPYR
jgi:hypothetical protein